MGQDVLKREYPEASSAEGQMIDTPDGDMAHQSKPAPAFTGVASRGDRFGTPALEARRLTLGWGDDFVVVRDISLAVYAGEIVCMVGRSGCGKTTILHALAGLTLPREGSVLLDGHEVTGEPGHVSYMFQKDLLLPSQRVIDNVCLPLTLHGMSREEAHAKALPLFERFGLGGCEQRWPAELSGGMRQRAAFLRTYLTGCEVALLDEPFSALDALTRADLRSWYCGMSRELGMASLAITHDVDEAVTMADRIYVLEGDPRAGQPSSASAVVEVPRPSGDVSAAEFALTHEFVDCKREVLGLLGV